MGLQIFHYNVFFFSIDLKLSKHELSRPRKWKKKLICKVMLNQKMWELKSKHSVVQPKICDVTTLEVGSQHGKNN